MQLRKFPCTHAFIPLPNLMSLNYSFMKLCPQFCSFLLFSMPIYLTSVFYQLYSKYVLRYFHVRSPKVTPNLILSRFCSIQTTTVLYSHPTKKVFEILREITTCHIQISSVSALSIPLSDNDSPRGC